MPSFPELEVGEQFLILAKQPIANKLNYQKSKNFVEKHNHINGIENFWSQAKRHLRKFNGIPKAHFELYLKECEWRFNHSDLKVQISILKQLVRRNLA